MKKINWLAENVESAEMILYERSRTNTQNLYEFIDLAKIRTAMYTGENTISAMCYTINGYFIACWVKNIEEDLQPDFGLFHDFVADYYKYSESTAGWKNIILAENSGDEKLALKKFFELFDLFRQNKN